MAAQAFGTIPDRANGQTILQGWFNVLKNAGVCFANFFGLGLVPQTNQTFVDGAVSAAVVGALFDGTVFKSVEIELVCRRFQTSPTLNKMSKYEIKMNFVSGVWETTPVIEQKGNSLTGLTFTVSNPSGTDGQLNFAASTLGGTDVTSDIEWRATTWDV